MNSLRLFTLLLVIVACSRREQSNNETPLLNSRVNPQVEMYMKKEFPLDSTRLEDSLHITALQATLYRVRPTQGFDRPVYTLIRDHSTDSIYQLILPGWPGKLDPTCHAQTSALAKGEKPPNPYLRGLEKFLNQRTGSTLPLVALDSVFLFWWPELKGKITDVKVVEDFLASTLHDQEAYPNMSKKWVTEMTGLLRKKFIEKNVLMYPAMGIFYAEIVKADPASNPTPQETYKLIAFRIGFNTCPD